MTFHVPADAYNAFMGRFSEPLAGRFVDFAVPWSIPDDDAPWLDVGCGPGALLAELTARRGTSSDLAAVDPSEPFAAAARQRFPGVDVQVAPAEMLPWDDDTFSVALAQLVVHFMQDPVAGLAEMRRVTRPGGVVAACVWDHSGGGSPLSLFYRAARELDPHLRDESNLIGTREGQLRDLAVRVGLREVRDALVSVRVPMTGFEEWWQPFTLGVGPAGDVVAGLDEARREQLRDRCRALLPSGSFEVPAAAWAVRGVV